MTIYSIYSDAWNGVKSILQVFEPHQPMIAGGMIASKIGCSLYRNSNKRSREERALINRIGIISYICNKTSDDQLKKRLSVRLKILNSQLADLRKSRALNVVVLGQLPSLVFPHPGSNLWHFAHQIINRGVQITYASKDTVCLPTIASVAGGAISMIGTTMSILRQTSMIDENNSLACTLIEMAIVVSAIEGVCISSMYLKSLLKDSKSLTNSAFKQVTISNSPQQKLLK